PYVANLHIFYPIFSAKKSGEVIGMAAAGQSIKRRFGKLCNKKHRNNERQCHAARHVWAWSS
ncbi:hypothetical protein, partial [Enterobacter intestinihominis]